jgi:glycosyltransferase involved in cell wall biosynthesis
MRPLRFCHLTTFYPPHNFGGDGVGVQRLCRALARRGHHVTVVHDVDAYNSLHRGPEPKAEPEPAGVEVVGLRSGLGRLSPLLTQQFGHPLVSGPRLAKLLDEGRFDVINFHNVSLVGGPGLLGYGRGIKLYMAHEHWLVCPSHVLWRHNRELCTGRECLRCVLNYNRPPQLWRYGDLLERESRHVDTFIAMSEFSRGKHREFGFPREMEVLPYFLPDPEPGGVPPWELPAEPSPHPRPYFLFVGRLEKIKGLEDVIPLFREFTEADFLIAGAGEYGEHLREVASGLERVRFLGRVPLGELARYYRHSLALIVPSICFETFGIILIEAFKAGTPVIARRIGPFPEIVERAGSGELFSTREELLAAMRTVQSDAVRRAEHVRRGYEAYREHWSESAVVPRYLELVRRAAERKRNASVLGALGAPGGSPA